MINIKITDKENDPIGSIQSLKLPLPFNIENISGESYSIKSRFNASRIILVKSKLNDTFSRGFINVHAQIRPIEIFVYEDDKEIAHLHNVWFTKIYACYAVDDWFILEDIELECESISGTITYS